MSAQRANEGCAPLEEGEAGGHELLCRELLAGRGTGGRDAPAARGERQRQERKRIAQISNLLSEALRRSATSASI